jgi:hypothetical protein
MPQAGCFLRNASLHTSLAGRVLALAGRQNLTEDDFVHLACRDADALQHALDDGGAALMRWRIGKRTVKRTNRGAVRAGDDDGWGAHDSSSAVELVRNR